jgi:hypothetical protein
MSYTPPPPPEQGGPGDQPGGIPYPGPGQGGPGYGGPGYGGPGYGGPAYGGYGPGYGAPRTNPKAVWALVLGIVGVLCCGFFAGIPALFLGNSAKKEIAYSGGTQSGTGMAQAGVVLGIISIVLTILGIIFFVLTGVFSGNVTTSP